MPVQPCGRGNSAARVDGSVRPIGLHSFPNNELDAAGNRLAAASPVRALTIIVGLAMIAAGERRRRRARPTGEREPVQDLPAEGMSVRRGLPATDETKQAAAHPTSARVCVGVAPVGVVAQSA